jgi:bifunctional non-homologous end joining protein LigD
MARLKGHRAAMPTSVSPMLCTLTREPINDDNYIYEIKWDGYRIISFVNGNNVKMHSRSGLDYTKKYPPVANALKELHIKMVVDGEVVVLNKEGFPDFDALQLYDGHKTPIIYYVFDILWLNGHDLKALPLTERKKILADLLRKNKILKISESFADGPALYKQSVDLNLEGIVAKKKDSTYNEGERANNWLKTPTRKRQEFVIGGWAESDKARSFRSLLFGAYNNGNLEWIGRSGGGYKEKEMPEILAKLKKLEIKHSPFINKVLDSKGAVIHWVKPELVANFEFATWTKSGRIRKPATFLGFRKDKKAKDVVREVPKSMEAIEEQIHVKEKRERKTSKYSNWRILEAIKPASESEFIISNCTIRISDIEKEIWKGVPKLRLIEYYHSIFRYIRPYIKDRPLSLHIKYKGAFAPGLYIKDMEGRQPECADIFTDKRRHPKAGKRNEIDYLVCNNEATLLYLINLGCIDINPWMSRTTNPEKPDFVNIDLDPGDDNYENVIHVAQAAKEVLDKYKLKAFPKTSGKTGLHIYIPVSGFNFQQARNISEKLGEQIQKLVPKISTQQISISLRGNKVFIDPSQNDYADTLASVYSVRPHKIPAVSAPLEWKEIKAGLHPSAFTIDTMLKRIKKKGDLFRGVLDPVIAKKNSVNLNTLL